MTDISPVVASFIAVLETVPVGGGYVAVGDGTDPNHEIPYLVVTQPSSLPTDGTMADGRADVKPRIRLMAVGETAEQARKLRDRAAEYLTDAALRQELTSHSLALLYLEQDISFEGRDDRGLPEPRFMAIHDFIVAVTPQPGD